MAEAADGSEGNANLQLPEKVALSCSSPAGPFARGMLDVSGVRVALVNGTEFSVAVNRVFLSPLTDAVTGLAPRAARAALSATLDKSMLDPGEAAGIEIGGAVPAHPGTYAAQLKAIPESGAAAVTTVSVAVAAHAGWGIACMLLGLLLLGVLLLGVLKLLTGEGDVQNKAREVLRTRGELHAWLQRDPPPQRQAEAVAEIDRNLDEAVRALARPHPFSVVDRRVSDAEAALSAAREAASKLREMLSKVPPGTAEVVDLTEDWRALHKRMQDLASLEAAAPTQPVGLAAHAGMLMHRIWEHAIDLPLQWVASDLRPQLERVHLAQAAGESERARAMALATRSWLRRAADDLDRRLALMMGLKVAVGGMVVSDAWVRQLAAGDELPPERRSALLDRLTGADAALAAGSTLEDLYAAKRAVGDAETEADRDRAEALNAWPTASKLRQSW